MLLPSALDCAPGIQPMRSIYTTNAVLSPPPSHHQSTNSPANILSTCRALQSLITTNLTPPHIIAKSPCAQPSLASPIVLAPPNHPHSPKSAQAPRSHTIKTAPQPQPQPQPATTKKRPRSPSSSDNHPPRNQNRATTTAPSTPKRQRLHPPTLPLGLSRADYATLQTQAAAIPIPSTPPTHPSKTTHSPPVNTALSPPFSPPTTTLLSLLLQNLRLHPRDWDECARGHDSIGARFDLLLGSQEGGLRRLRRGRGRGEMGRGRKSVQEVEFGMG